MLNCHFRGLKELFLLKKRPLFARFFKKLSPFVEIATLYQVSECSHCTPVYAVGVK